MNLDELRAMIPAVADRTYLNTGTSGPTPRPAIDEEIALLELIGSEGFASPPAMRAYMEALSGARRAIAGAISAPANTVALMHSTSEGLGVVAAGLTWKAGDEIIISDLEHTSGIAPWVHLARTHGVKIINLESHEGALPASAISQACTDRTRLVCISHVSYATGAVLPIQEVVSDVEKVGGLVVVDGAQGAGHVPVDVGAMECHAYAFPGQKWLLGPEGTGGLYVREDVIDRIEPTRVGWASVESEDLSGLSFSFHADARRFETGTMHAPAFASLAKAIQILTSIGWEQIFEHARDLAHQARRELETINEVRILSPSDAASGLLTFQVDGVDQEALVKQLWSKHRIVVRSIPKPYSIRASFHAFNTEGEVGRLVEAIRQELG